MRVTKAVRDYIEKQVCAKVEPKYADKKAHAEKAYELRCDLERRATEAAKEAAKAVLLESKNFPDFLECDEKQFDRLYLSYLSYVLDTKTKNWQREMNNEVKEIVTNIIVTLELGGSKADLDRMLNEI